MCGSTKCLKSSDFHCCKFPEEERQEMHIGFWTMDDRRKKKLLGWPCRCGHHETRYKPLISNCLGGSLHISRQGIIYNEVADQLASIFLTNLINPILKAQTFRDILRRRVTSKTKLPFPSLLSLRADNILYYRSKSNSLVLRKEEFTWHKQTNTSADFITLLQNP